ncbi:hypothetical protein [Kineosporia sp. R_H_3]|uniref:hypothetical protein n=1 Tax=Kineosporia sp. R_H_3 TaxID=1961848 RepID=UPI001304506A|nr:hypothetical protein [Kineosporia sp. R_H_3]
MPWCVQSTWTVDDEQRAYAPVVVRWRWQAWSVARRMTRTLAHFPTLVVEIRKASAADLAAAAQVAAPDGPPADVHLSRFDDGTSLCGLVHGDVAAVLHVDLFDDTGPACPRCLARMRDM